MVNRSWKSFSLDGGTLFLQSSCLSFGSLFLQSFLGLIFSVFPHYFRVYELWDV